MDWWRLVATGMTMIPSLKPLGAGAGGTPPLKALRSNLSRLKEAFGIAHAAIHGTNVHASLISGVDRRRWDAPHVVRPLPVQMLA